MVYIVGMTDTLIAYFTQPTEKWSMPYVPITIVDTTKSPMFELGVLYEGVFIFFAAAYILGSDMLRVCFMGHISCQFRILQNTLK